MLVPTAEQARDTASSPSGCAMHCIAIGATRMGMLKRLPAHQIAARTFGSGSLPKTRIANRLVQPLSKMAHTQCRTASFAAAGS